MKLFIAYPYDFNERGYREAFATEFDRSDVSLLYADERLANDHVLYKIREMMSEADTCLFDISGNNPNVMLELGIAIGDGHPGFVAVDEARVTDIGADVVGWDQLRYSSYSELATKVHRYVQQGGLPMREASLEENQFEVESDNDDVAFFDQIIMPGVTGHYDLTVHPAAYNEGRIARADLRGKFRQLEVSYSVRSNIPDRIPYDIADCTVENFASGVSFIYRHKEWGRWEAARLHTSGLYRIARVFRDDFGADGTLRQTDQTIGVADLIEQVTLFYLLAREVARVLTTDVKECFCVNFRVGRLLNRRPRLDAPCRKPTFLISAHTGTEQEVCGSSELSLGELEERAVEMATKQIEDIFWIFGLGTEVIVPVQRRFLANTEPRAFPSA